MLTKLEPKEVFQYFEEISRVPRGSNHMEKISDFLVDFAKKQGLEYYQDALKNVIIIKEATEGYEKEAPIILQGHMDMVLVKKEWCQKDLLTEGLDLQVEGDYLFAEGTSLGGDDGVAVAFAMAILASKTLRHPKLEMILTVNEEVGMDGACGIDVSMLQGKTMINLDSEEEGSFLSSCAGGASVECTKAFERQMQKGTLLQVSVKGLLGGHSGEEIHRERGNANKLLGRILWKLCEQNEVFLYDCMGGLADNAIPACAEMKILLKEKDVKEQVERRIHQLEEEIKKELEDRDPNVNIVCMEACNMEDNPEEFVKIPVVSYESTKQIAALLMAFPNGVQGMSMQVKGLVETSLNLGIIAMTKTCFKACFCVRSSVDSKKYELIDALRAIAGLSEAKCEVTGDYPGWKYKKHSPLREKMCRIYKEMYGKEAKIEAIHAGVECGFFAMKIPGLDCVSIGPDMKDIHTAEEKLSISSTKRVFEFIIRLLEERY